MDRLKNYFLALMLISLMLVTTLVGSSMASTQGSMVHLTSPTRYITPAKERDLNRIMSVLESRIRNHQLPAKVRNKLASMNDEEIRLLTSLCDRVSKTGETTGSDLAVMLVTALIVLS